MDLSKKRAHVNENKSDSSGVSSNKVIRLMDSSKQEFDPSCNLEHKESAPMEMDTDSEYEDDNEINGATKKDTKCPPGVKVATTTEQPSNSNIKLVLKKSQPADISNNSLVQTKNSANKIFVVTWVTNTATRPVLTSSSYSTVQPVAKVLDTAVAPISSVIGDPSDPIKMEMGHQHACDLSRRPLQENKVNSDTAASDAASNKSAELGSREENDDIESIQSEPSEVKASTPKIPRELILLQKTVNESKILSEYMNESGSSKGRKSKKVPLKPGSDTELFPLVANRRSRSRSCSKPRIESPIEGIDMSKWLSEEKLNKRQNMRSQNTEFVQKHMKFLNRLHGDGEVSDNSEGEQLSLNETKIIEVESQIQIIRRNWQPPPKPGWDSFCWKCHNCGDVTPCSKCPRSYHIKCLRKNAPSGSTLICPECNVVDSSLKGVNRTWKGTPLLVDHLNQLLQFALKRMRQLKGIEFFDGAVNEDDHPEYYKYIVNPVTLESLQKKVDNKAFKCAEEFAIEAKWIQHNTMVYFGNGSKLLTLAKGLVKVCRQEVTEIETCPECYFNANTSKDWFVEVCSKPHILLWAKLKGFPYWPAKAMGTNPSALVNVRFFGDYDRAYVPIKECFLYSEKDPNPPTKKTHRNNMASCIKEVDIHIKKIIAKFGSFKFAPFKTPYDPNKELAQLESMIPGVAESIKKAQASPKPALTYKIVKTADNHLSIIKKPDLIGSEASPKADKLTDNTKDTIQIVERKSSVSSDAGSFSKSSGVSSVKTSSPLKTYEVVTKKDEAEPKVGSVILKRKSDNWNMVASTSSTSKKQKNIESDSVRGEQVISSTSDCNSSKTSSEKTVLNSAEDVVIYKRKRSEDGATTSKAHKSKVDESKRIPPMVLTASTSQVSSSAHSCSSAPAVSGLNSGDEVASNSEYNKTGSTTDKNNENEELVNLSAAAQNINGESVAQTAVADVNVNNIEKEPSQENSQAVEPIKTSQTSIEGSNKPCEIIPLEDIKTEKPDNSDDGMRKSSEPIAIRSKTATPERRDPPKSIASTSNDQQNTLAETENVVVKTETPSDDDEGVTLSSKVAETSSETIGNRKNKGVVPTQRISVKDIATMCIQSTAGKKPEVTDKKRDTGVMKTNEMNKQDQAPCTCSPKESYPEVMKVEMKKQNQRARKSFPNKLSFTVPTVPTVPNSPSPIYPPKKVTSISYQNTSKNMVYIPLDSTGQTSSIPSLTAVSKMSAVQPGIEASTNSLSALSSPTFQSTMPTAAGPQSESIQTPPGPVPTTISIMPLAATSSITAMAPSTTQTVTSPSSGQQVLPPGDVSSTNDHMLTGFVTPGLAAAITDAIVRGPPRLAPKPSRALGAEGNTVFPSTAGPVCNFLMESSHKISDFFRSVIEDTLADMASSGVLEAKVKILELDMEKMKHSYEKQLEELKHNTDVMLCEMRNSWEKERQALIAETRKQCEAERVRAIEECKKKQWCANCGKEAQFYCCWNTSYCDYPCQQKHWTRHMNSCAQNDNPDANAQKIGVKITPISAKDKKSKNTEAASAPRPSGQNFIRATMPMPRNPVPVQRLVPLPNNAAPPRYTLLNREGNWELMPSPGFPRVIPTPNIIVADSNGKVGVNSPAQTIIRTNQM